MKVAPVILFAYNRPQTTLQTLEALEKNELASQTLLYAFVDGPKNNKDISSIKEVTEIITGRRWTRDIVLFSSATNKGLAKSVIDGVTKVMTEHSSAIVLEDDIVTSPYFLRFMNEGLTAYEAHKNVFSVNSFVFPLGIPEVKTFLSPWATTSWGWATWSDRWKQFEHVPVFKKQIQENPFIRSRFNIGDYDFASLLNNENSWGIRWYYTAFLRQAIGLYPTRPLCKNIGFGIDATHTKESFQQDEVYQGPIAVTVENSVDLEIFGSMVNYFKTKKEPYQRVLINRLKKTLSRS